MQLVKKYGKKLLFPGILCVIFLYFFLQLEDSAHSPADLISTIPQEENNEQLNISEPQEEEIQKVVVDVKGAVKFPGVYELTTDDRIIDAVGLAGGYTNDAETKMINHAQKLQDEMVIYIPKQGEDVIGEMEHIGQVVSVPSTTNNSTSNSVNINTADETTLTTLPGIGPSKAQAIVAYRQENGSFKTIDELKNVTGIGDKTFEKLKDLIVVK